MSKTVETNRAHYLNVLRTGNYKKGTIKSDDKGFPVINSKEDDDGYCACAIMIKEFSPRGNFLEARMALGISAKDCTYIQRNLNDTNMSFPEIANEIEHKIFKQHEQEMDCLRVCLCGKENYCKVGRGRWYACPRI